MTVSKEALEKYKLVLKEVYGTEYVNQFNDTELYEQARKTLALVSLAMTPQTSN